MKGTYTGNSPKKKKSKSSLITIHFQRVINMLSRTIFKDSCKTFSMQQQRSSRFGCYFYQKTLFFKCISKKKSVFLLKRKTLNLNIFLRNLTKRRFDREFVKKQQESYPWSKLLRHLFFPSIKRDSFKNFKYWNQLTEADDKYSVME